LFVASGSAARIRLWWAAERFARSITQHIRENGFTQMLWNASAMTGYAIKASNGEIGTVSDMIFEDVDWAIRWLIVDTGEWLPGRKVFLPVSSLGTADPRASPLPVNLTMRQIGGKSGYRRESGSIVRHGERAPRLLRSASYP
jgi:hypothetical protein